MTWKRHFLALVFIVKFLAKFSLILKIINSNKSPRTHQRKNGEKKQKRSRNKMLSVREYTYHQIVIPFKYCLHAEIIPPNMEARQVQDYYNIRFFMYKEAIALRHNTVIAGTSVCFLKDPSQSLLL